MSSEREQFDNFLRAMAQKHKHGVAEFLGTLAGFLRRNTDFFTGTTENVWEDVLLTVFRQEAKKAVEMKQQKGHEECNNAKSLENVSMHDKQAQADKTEAVEQKKVENDKESKIAVECIGDGTSQNHIDYALSQPITEVDDEQNKDDIGRLVPNLGNGCNLPRYKWTQTLRDIEITVPVKVEFKLRSSKVNVKFAKNYLEIGLKNEKPLVEGDLLADIKVDDCFWTLEPPNKICLTLVKAKDDWWARLLMGDPEIALSKIVPEQTKLSDLDDSTRCTVEKMLYEQRQKAMGEPIGDPEQKQAIEKFMAQHPEMDFSKCKY